ncbi:endonuclease/exonuclease/phosphatase family protein [Sphingobacterium thalpophilum]|uniref:Endonuclease/Exonuclease/phosphatase family n=1 Tax=Sphingobacterium thalpophilum TaxID=259 RepID=A0A4U9UJS9_9SPHI|nr:endonuclease [Sphingobacterium thalpophilum]VTR33760.1 Endonuclease/Exonuclease/phosphatase family [Sphingobacterium thalpophilum]
MNYRQIGYILCLVLSGMQLCTAQSNRRVYPIAFYNLENLYDPIKDSTINDDEFTPTGANTWTETKYRQKIKNMARAIRAIGSPVSSLGPIALGVAEIENRRVLEDLARDPQLGGLDLQIIHHDSPDRRGVDVGFLYNPAFFTPFHDRVYPFVLPDNPNFKTRDQLLVSGTVAGDTLHIIVNHWPSRYGNKSSELREFAATITKGICDSLYRENPEAKIIIMGDLNDDPNNKSVKEVLEAKKNPQDVPTQGLFNTMWKFYDRGIGSLGYQGQWNLFDQIIISKPLLENKNKGLRFAKAEIFNRDFLVQQEGRNKGYPHRTFSGGVFINGFSDHFPTLIYLVK